jgi:hypothetical protein
MRTAAKIRLLVFLSGLMTVPAYAHHSFGMFDVKKCLTMAGTVKKLEWEYPHIWLWLVTEGADHSQVIWGFEGGDPGTLAVQGWNADILKKGDKITVYFNPLLDGRKGGSMRVVVLPNGNVVSGQTSLKADQKYHLQGCGPSK